MERCGPPSGSKVRKYAYGTKESMYLEYMGWCTEKGIVLFFHYYSIKLWFYNLVGFPHVCYNYFHSRRCIEGIGIKKSDIFSNPTVIELSTLKTEIDNLTNSKAGLWFFFYKFFFLNILFFLDKRKRNELEVKVNELEDILEWNKERKLEYRGSIQ